MCKETKATVSGISLRATNSINYAPMMASDEEDRDEDKKPTSNKIRPKSDGPSSAVCTRTWTMSVISAAKVSLLKAD